MKVLWIVFISLFFLLFALSCQEDPSTSPEDTTTGSMQLALDMKSAPDEVATIDGQLSRSDMDTVFFDFNIQGDSAVADINNISGTTGNTIKHGNDILAILPWNHSKRLG